MVTERRKSYWNSWRIWRLRSPSCVTGGSVLRASEQTWKPQHVHRDKKCKLCRPAGRASRRRQWTSRQLWRSKRFLLGNKWSLCEPWLCKTHTTGQSGALLCMPVSVEKMQELEWGSKELSPEPLPTSWFLLHETNFWTFAMQNCKE